MRDVTPQAVRSTLTEMDSASFIGAGGGSSVIRLRVVLPNRDGGVRQIALPIAPFTSGLLGGMGNQRYATNAGRRKQNGTTGL